MKSIKLSAKLQNVFDSSVLPSTPLGAARRANYGAEDTCVPDVRDTARVTHIWARPPPQRQVTKLIFSLR